MEDPVRHVTFWFGPFEYEILSALDGERDVDAVAVRIGATHADERARVHALVDELAKAGLVVGEQAALVLAADRLLQVAEDDAYWGQVEVRPLRDRLPLLEALTEAPDAECAECRLPCCSYAIDVAPDEVDLLVDAARSLGVPPEELFAGDSTDADGGRLLRLAQRGDLQCVLLDGGGLCRVHAAFGLARKPVVCQLYPGHPVVTPGGPRLGLRSGCTRPVRAQDAVARSEYQRALTRMAETRPALPIPHAPASVRVSRAVRTPWRAYDPWERQAVRLVEEAATADAGLLAAAASLLETFDGAARRDAAGGLGPVAGGLASLLADGGRLREGGVAGALAGGAPPLRPRPCPTRHVALAIDAFFPLRFPTVLAGLGVLRLLVACVDRDPDASARPLEAVAHWFRLFRSPSVHLALVHGDVAGLEALACEEAPQ